jgi:hypothetical protein
MSSTSASTKEIIARIQALPASASRSERDALMTELANARDRESAESASRETSTATLDPNTDVDPNVNTNSDPSERFNADNYSVQELLQLLNLPPRIEEVTENDVLVITNSNITKYKGKAISKQLTAPRESAQYMQLALFYREIQAKLVKAARAYSIENASPAESQAARERIQIALGASGVWDAAVSKSNADASAAIRTRARTEAAEAAAQSVSQAWRSKEGEEADILERQQEEYDQFDVHAKSRLRVMSDANEQLRWARNQYLPWERQQEEQGPNQEAGGAQAGPGTPVQTAPTNRYNQFELAVDENGHYMMKQRQLNIPSAYNVPIAQGAMNPTLRNMYTRIVVINSKRRATLFPHSTDPTAASSSTNFNVQLSEELKNVVSLQMTSITLPYSWYAVDAATGTNCFHVTATKIDPVSGGDSNSVTTTITVPTGNYTPVALIAEIQSQLASADESTLIKGHLSASYVDATGRCRFTNTSAGTVRLKLTFFDPKRALDCAAGCRQSNKINNSLGWILGFRSNSVHTSAMYNSFALDGMVYDMPESPAGFTLTSEAVVDTYGPKYFMLVLDDYKNNRINGGVVSVTNTETRLDQPYYYDTDIPCESIPDPFGGATDKITVNIPSEPRTLTEAQLYSINEIRRNRGFTRVDRVAEPTSSNVFAIINFNKNGLAVGSAISDSSPALAAYTRDYFGPVTLQRLKVTLVDDNGFVVNLNGNDWSFTFAAKALYEY